MYLILRQNWYHVSYFSLLSLTVFYWEQHANPERKPDAGFILGLPRSEGKVNLPSQNQPLTHLSIPALFFLSSMLTCTRISQVPWQNRVGSSSSRNSNTCSSPSLMNSVVEMFKNCGVKKKNIVWSRYKVHFSKQAGFVGNF